MLTKYSVLMMLLIVTASLVGISSSIYKPANVETQPQQSPAQPLQPQQSPQQQQLQSPNTAPHTLGKRLTSPQGMQQQQKSDVVTAVQIREDRALVDRLFPYIIQKIDGKTLAQKIDVATLLQKIDAKTLAAKVLPFLDIKVVAIERPGLVHSIDITGLSKRVIRATASCAPGESLVGGGFQMNGYDHSSPYFLRKETGRGNSWAAIPNTNTWVAHIGFSHDAEFATLAECLTVELTLKEEQQQP